MEASKGIESPPLGDSSRTLASFWRGCSVAVFGSAVVHFEDSPFSSVRFQCTEPQGQQQAPNRLNAGALRALGSGLPGAPIPSAGP